MTVQHVIERVKQQNSIVNSLEQDEKIIILNALEKQIPYKPQEYEDKYYACKCGNVLLMKWEKYPTKLMPKSRGLICCLACGQKLDWSE